MEVRFANKTLERIETDDPPLEQFSVAIIKSARSKLNFIRSAKDERDLRNWKSLHYEKLSGDRIGQRSIRLNRKMRMIFTIDDTATSPTVTIIEIADYH